MKAQNVKNQMTVEEAQILASLENVSKSEKIRNMFLGGLDVKTISKVLDIRYNFAYNVLSNFININGIAVDKTERDGSGRAAVVAALATGASLADVSKQTKVNYNQVWKIAKETGMTKKQLAEATVVVDVAAEIQDMVKTEAQGRKHTSKKNQEVK